MRIRHLACTGIALALACLTAAVNKAAGDAPATAPAKPSTFKLIIGHDTTRVDGPLLANGTVDYNTAFCEETSEGTNADSNATQALLAALAGWVPYKPRALSADESKSKDQQLSAALTGSWKPGQLPLIEEWLTSNATKLAEVSEACKRPRLEPGKADPGELPGPNLPIGLFREASRALVVRAMERLATGDQSGAMSDAATAHQLAVHLSQLPDQASNMVAQSLIITVARAQLAAIRSSDAQASEKWFQQRLEEKPASPDMPAIEDIGQRFQDLYEVMLAIQGQQQVVLKDLFFSGDEQQAKDSAILVGDLDQVDWNVILRHINDVDDQAVAIMREQETLKRLSRIREFSAARKAEETPGDFDSEVLIPSIMEPGTSTIEQKQARHREAFQQRIAAFLRRKPAETVPAYSLRIAGMFTHVSYGIEWWVRDAAKAEAESEVYTTAMALELFKKKTGNYPGDLAELVPKTLARAPVDPFSAGPLIYRPTETGYILYSVGPNGKDDRGQSSNPKDDIAVRSGD